MHVIVLVRVCVCMPVHVCTFLGAFSSWSSKGALAKLKHTAKTREIEEAIAKSDWSTARHLLDKVSSGKQNCPICHICC